LVFFGKNINLIDEALCIELQIVPFQAQSRCGRARYDTLSDLVIFSQTGGNVKMETAK
jgi:hypothetical protein